MAFRLSDFVVGPYPRILFWIAFSFFYSPIFAFDHSHSAFETELKRHVKGDRVDYSSWKKNRTGLDLYLRTLSELTPTEFERFTDSEKLAFWINAYNAFTVRLILDREPVRSIRDIERFGG
ncbi:hypothetical protein CH375_10835, partial [Leptospira ellisii]